jgi:hypothetical protein
MRLGISSDADPQATLDQLVAACGRRGLSALELRVMGEAGSVRGGAAEEWLSGATALHGDRAPAVTGLLVDVADAEALALRCAGLDTPLVLAGDASPAERLAYADRLTAARLHGAPPHGGPSGGWLDAHWRLACRSRGRSTTRCRTPPATCAGSCSGHTSLPTSAWGGGPETTEQGGRGIGEAMTRLALAGYAGPLILTPSSRRYRVIWSTWLGRRGGWGCGSKVVAS